MAKQYVNLIGVASIDRSLEIFEPLKQKIKLRLVLNLQQLWRERKQRIEEEKKKKAAAKKKKKGKKGSS